MVKQGFKHRVEMLRALSEYIGSMDLGCPGCATCDKSMEDYMDKIEAICRGALPEPREATLSTLQAEIKGWADEVLPGRTWWQALTKLQMEEIPELLKNPNDPLEYADLFIILVDLAAMKGVDIADAVHRKIAINRQRTWGIDPETGLLRHTKEGDHDHNNEA